MLHVDTKKSKWKDLPIPFPATGAQKLGVPGDTGGTKQLRKVFPTFPISRKHRKNIPEETSPDGNVNASS
jgi:hypothetical protein